MVDRLQEVARCVEVGCKGAARFSRPGDSVVSYCRRHKQPGMVEPSPRKRKPPPRGKGFGQTRLGSLFRLERHLGEF